METLFLQRTTTDVPWGFRLYGGCDYSQPLTIQKVTAGSVASENVEAGDIIVKISNRDTSSMTHAQAMEVIKSSGNSLQLGILRRAGTIQNDEVVSPTSSFHHDPIPPLQFDRQLSLDSNNPSHDNNANGWNHSNNTNYQQQKVPDAILNMAAKGDSIKKPFSYVVDINDIQMQREKVKKKSPGRQVIPRYQNLLNMPQFEDSPRARGLRPSGPTSSPAQPSGDAVAANLQFNSPLKMYSTDNVIESLRGQTGAEIKDVVGLQNKEKTDITQSAVYKMIHGIDQPKPKPAISYAEARSVEGEMNQNDDNSVDEYHQRSIRYTGNSIPSRSFKMLQSMTTGDNKPPSAALKRPVTVDTRPQPRQPTGHFRSPDVFQSYPGYSSPSYGQQYGRGGSVERREGSSEVDTTSIYQHLRGVPASDDYNEKSVRYVGRSIPSKCFKLLQDMTGGPNENDASPGTPKRPCGPARHSSPQVQSDDDRPRNLKYTGNNIPSQSFKMLQRYIGGGPSFPGSANVSVSLPSQPSTEEQESTEF